MQRNRTSGKRPGRAAADAAAAAVAGGPLAPVLPAAAERPAKKAKPAPRPLTAKQVTQLVRVLSV